MTMLTLQNGKFNVMCNNFWKKQTISFCEPAKNIALINLSGTFILQTQSLSVLGFNFGKLLLCQAEQNNQHKIMQKMARQIAKKGSVISKLHFIIFWSLVLQISCNFVCICFLPYHCELSIKVDIFLFAAYFHSSIHT